MIPKSVFGKRRKNDISHKIIIWIVEKPAIPKSVFGKRRKNGISHKKIIWIVEKPAIPKSLLEVMEYDLWKYSNVAVRIQI